MSGKRLEIEIVFEGSTRSMLSFEVHVHDLSAHQDPQSEDLNSRGNLGRRILWWTLFCKHGIVSRLAQKEDTTTPPLLLCIIFFALSIMARPAFRAPSLAISETFISSTSSLAI
tara:strand:- start:90 stop:431 length:342 start_codon:yes stop_codon:yes gene_type:complete